MPAYRSSAEAEIRVPVVARLRELIPGCRIIHEINASGFGNRIDVLAVGVNRIAAVEIKSSKDKLDRLPDQIEAMKGCAHYTIAALHAKFFEVRNGKGKPWASVDWSITKGARAWGFGFTEEIDSQCVAARHELYDQWDKPSVCPPPGAINMLWREELRAIVNAKSLVKASSKLTMPELIDVIRWRMTGEEITHNICSTLRTRSCVEADEPIFEEFE